MFVDVFGLGGGGKRQEERERERKKKKLSGGGGGGSGVCYKCNQPGALGPRLPPAEEEVEAAASARRKREKKKKCPQGRLASLTIRWRPIEKKFKLSRLWKSFFTTRF